jgi:hypothetical protein
MGLSYLAVIDSPRPRAVFLFLILFIFLPWTHAPRKDCQIVLRPS